MTIKNLYTATSAEPGDVFACIVTCHITPMGYRFYRCAYPSDNEYEGIPQGDNYPNGQIIDLFPIVRNLEIPED